MNTNLLLIPINFTLLGFQVFPFNINNFKYIWHKNVCWLYSMLIFVELFKGMDYFSAVHQLLVGYLMPKFHSFENIWS